ncbi:hypothetical protein MSG28_013874 [Choristoneura fumiferana]|uniref:Uncharacterized protein n=1 Tax=Choristoneura fumiferana TaxID=7141 RepID=A0ACC0K9U6_CHOFU|nr:hypothetical protein MSG28_013874 [Choristoneura fumiferana]
MMFATGMCLLALLAYAVRDWFHLSLLTSLPFILLYGFFWITPESPRWLVSRGRVAEAEKVLITIARRNSIILPRGFLLEIHVVGPCAKSARIATAILLANPAVKQQCLHCCVSAWRRKIKDQEDLEATILSNANGHVPGFPLLTTKEEIIDRRISNMLTFKPEPKPAEENIPKPDSLERIIALEVAEIVNKRSKLKRNTDATDLTVEDTYEEECPFNVDAQKTTQIAYRQSPVTIRKKSVQLINRMFQESPEKAEDKIIDEQNSEGGL